MTIRLIGPACSHTCRGRGIDFDEFRGVNDGFVVPCRKSSIPLLSEGKHAVPCLINRLTTFYRSRMMFVARKKKKSARVFGSLELSQLNFYRRPVLVPRACKKQFVKVNAVVKLIEIYNSSAVNDDAVNSVSSSKQSAL